MSGNGLTSDDTALVTTVGSMSSVTSVSSLVPAVMVAISVIGA